jgi:hypothetical protein
MQSFSWDARCVHHLNTGWLSFLPVLLFSAIINHADEDTAAEIWARTRANGYQPESFKAKDSFKGLNKHIDEVKQDQDQILNLYIT